ncbi:MAG: hypothetical protein JXB85_04610, partial [Anaerolineales bacterium]|nr:hypothetical protein [Anaerolineales bacterium]
REFPFGNSFPLYNEKVVDKWAAAMRRYDAEKAFGKLHKTADLIKAIEYTNPSRDVVCPKCDGPAVKEGGDEDSKASKRVWCPTCGIEENFRG